MILALIVLLLSALAYWKAGDVLPKNLLGCHPDAYWLDPVRLPEAITTNYSPVSERVGVEIMASAGGEMVASIKEVNGRLARIRELCL
jgi:hypothetical protein